jgi:hypothetical protein
MVFGICIVIVVAGCKINTAAMKKDVVVDYQRLFGLHGRTALVTGASNRF